MRRHSPRPYEQSTSSSIFKQNGYRKPTPSTSKEAVSLWRRGQISPRTKVSYCIMLTIRVADIEKAKSQRLLRRPRVSHTQDCPSTRGGDLAGVNDEATPIHSTSILAPKHTFSDLLDSSLDPFCKLPIELKPAERSLLHHCMS